MKPKNPLRKEEVVREMKTSGGSANPIVLAQEHVAKTFEQLTHDLHELQSAFDKEREAVDTEKLKKPGHGAHNFDQPVLPVGDLAGKIEDTMIDTLYPWIGKFTQHGSTGVPKLVLPRLFQECLAEVTERHQLIKSILFPKGAKTNATLLSDHMCNSHEELFLLTPSNERTKALVSILDKIRAYLDGQRQFSVEQLNWIINGTGLDVVALRYREIMVQACLQEPPVTFSDDHGMYLEGTSKKTKFTSWLPGGTASAAPTETKAAQPFDSKRHSPVDCMDIGEGDLCQVIFPAMEVGGERLTRSYTLGLRQKALLPAEGPDEKQPSPSSADDNIMIVRDELDVWRTEVKSLRTVGQLRKLYIAIANMGAALGAGPAHDVYRNLGITQDEVSRWREHYNWFKTNQIADDVLVSRFKHASGKFLQ